jgi:exopolyphosphatase/pppGpp-phosphohydrolase
MAPHILRIGADRTTLGAGAFSIGWSSIARDFRRDQPSPLELENAIAAIEDEIARARSSIDADPVVATEEETIRDIARAAGIAPGDEMVLTIDAVERTFERLTRPPGLSADHRFAATLVILRELMHHLQIASITWSLRRSGSPPRAN